MSTPDDARMAEIRDRLNGYGNGYWERTYGHETCLFGMDIRKLLTDGVYLLAEVDRLKTDNDYLIGAQRGQLERADSLIADKKQLQAEVDRLTRDLAAVTEERDVNNIVYDEMRTKLSRAEHLALHDDDTIDLLSMKLEARDKALAALRAAHTWTVATPASMPPVGSGPWLVEWKQRDGYALYGRMRPSCDVWLNNAMQTDICKIDGTRFAAWPDEPAKEATPDV